MMKQLNDVPISPAPNTVMFLTMLGGDRGDVY